MANARKSPDVEFIGITQNVTPQNKQKSNILTDDDGSKIERRCENPDCTAPTLISLVPTKSTAQFIQNPQVIKEPILVNGYTTVFQIDGSPAKVIEAKDSSASGRQKFRISSPIYRIVPNTHAHIVNYVIVDAEGKTLKKIKENEPTTMRNLLESQVDSADQLLKKLMGIKKTDKKITPTTRIANPSISSFPTATVLPTTSSLPKASVLPIQTQTQLSTVQIPSQIPAQISSQIQLPMQISTQGSTIQLPAQVPIQIPAQLPGLASNTVAAQTQIPPFQVSIGAPYSMLTSKIPIITSTPQSSQIVNTTSLTSNQLPTPVQITNQNLSTFSISPLTTATPMIIDNNNSSNSASVLNANTINMSAFERMQAELNELRQSLQHLSQKQTDDTNDSKKRKLN